MTEFSMEGNIPYLLDEEGLATGLQKNGDTKPLSEVSDIKVVTLYTNMRISQNEIPYLRGAVISMVNNNGILFHDHEGDGFRYSYPLIQYKSIDGKAAIVAVGQGAEQIKLIFPYLNTEIRIGGRRLSFSLDDICSETVIVGFSEKPITYAVRHWLPLNQDNFEEYGKLCGLENRCHMLERLMIGNILSFAKSIGIFFDAKVETDIVDIESIQTYRFKKINMLGFDLIFKANVSLPLNIGLGKGVSLGFGTIYRNHKNED